MTAPAAQTDAHPHAHEPEDSIEHAAHDILAARPLPGGVVVIDLGGQYAQLIARRVREHGTFSSVLGHGASIERIRELEPCALILSGGPSSVYEDGAPSVSGELWELDVPILGICYGMQLMAQQLGGEVAHTDAAEYGRTVLRLAGPPAEGSLFAGTPETQDSWMSHRDAVVRAPAGSAVLASTDSTPIAAFGDPGGRRVGVQFHPEVVHTEFGTRILENFLDGLDATDAAWTPERFIELQTAAIRSAVGDRRVLCALSGGVDSSVAAALVHRAVGDQLICVFVDHGLLRAGESEQVMTTFGEDQGLGIRVIRVDAREHFLTELAGIEDPEEKRKRIGAAFIHVFDQQATELGDIELLVQGTLYSDVIESGGGTGGAAATIKSHHNVGGLPDDMQFSLLEPLRMLFKDEVRHVGAALGLPEAMVWRQPFPGPGLAIRIIGEVTAERLAIVRAADVIVREEIAAAGLERELWQSFAVLPAIRSVGVQGDARTYAYPIVIRAVTSDDAMTADWARLPYEVIERLSGRLMNEVDGVNRVVLDVSSKPPSTIEWE